MCAAIKRHGPAVVPFRFEHGSFLRQAEFAPVSHRNGRFSYACACAWTAGRIYRNEAIRFPVSPPADEKGLRMEIFA
jgi:hypothetical protein